MAADYVFFASIISGLAVLFFVILNSVKRYEKIFDHSHTFLIIAISIIVGGFASYIILLEVFYIGFYIYVLSMASFSAVIKLLMLYLIRRIPRDYNSMFYGLIAGAAFGTMPGVTIMYISLQSPSVSGVITAAAAIIDFVLINTCSGYSIGRGLMEENSTIKGYFNATLYEIPLFMIIFMNYFYSAGWLLIVLFIYSLLAYFSILKNMVYNLPKKQKRQILA